MNAAPSFSFAGQSSDIVEQFLSGKQIQCHAQNPFYDLDLSVLVSLEQFKNFSEVEPSVILGHRKESWRKKVWGIFEKRAVLESVENFLETHGMNRSLREDCLQCSDELISNAIFNAPFSEKISRNNLHLKIPGSSPIIFDVSVGDFDVVICCADPFGSLKAKPFFERILHCYQSGVADSIQYGKGGAGIGSFMIFEQSLSFMLGMVPDRRTAFYCRFPIKMSSKIRKSLPKNLIVFQREE